MRAVSCSAGPGDEEVPDLQAAHEGSDTLATCTRAAKQRMLPDAVAVDGPAASEFVEAARLEELQAQEDAANEEAASSNAAPKQRAAPKAKGFRRLIGICGYNVAPLRGQGSKCYFCSSAIQKETFRFEYQFSASGKIARYMHPTCVAQIPPQGLQNSINFLEGLQASDDVMQHAQDAKRVLAAMSRPSGQ